jgi:hypothetical protein
MSTVKLTHESIIAIQKHMLASGVWWSEDNEGKRGDAMAFRTNPANGIPLIIGGLVKDQQMDHEYFIWCNFNDLQGVTHQLKFRPFFMPKDMRQTAFQCYMHMNALMGRDHFTDLAFLRKDMEIMARVLPGRLPGFGEND